jgi:hypothetical protein
MKQLFLNVDLDCEAEVSLSIFALKAKPYETHVYGTSEQMPSERVMLLAHALYTEGLVHLFQKRVDTQLHYIAVKPKVAQATESVKHLVERIRQIKTDI